jgi:expansin (peptidoglycan-binding protein)
MIVQKNTISTRKSAILACTVALAATISGCVTTFTPVVNQTDISTVDFSKVSSMKQGESCAKWYFIFGPFGTESLVEAVKNGNISKVEIVDYKHESGFLTFSRCIVAYGK